MQRTLMGVSLVCPYCNQPVDPTKPNAMVNAATKQMQHKDCWTNRAPHDSNPPQNQS
ncbi:MAG TPA: hypothetical protein VG454_12300 [Gemmatimonadales bacterium]|nr:hypothetical protein [Gemmatimonadales bacterium]